MNYWEFMRNGKDKTPMSTLEDTISEAEILAKRYEDEAQRIIDQCGSGVRPAGVSTDLALAQYRAESYRKMAAELREAADEG